MSPINSTAITIKAIPAAVSIASSETRFANHRPSSTPNRLVVTKAEPAPRKTINGFWDSAVMSRVVSWVLSPISANKIVRKVEVNTLAKVDFVAGLTLGAGEVLGLFKEVEAKDAEGVAFELDRSGGMCAGSGIAMGIDQKKS